MAALLDGWLWPRIRCRDRRTHAARKKYDIFYFQYFITFVSRKGAMKMAARHFYRAFFIFTSRVSSEECDGDAHHSCTLFPIRMKTENEENNNNDHTNLPTIKSKWRTHRKSGMGNDRAERRAHHADTSSSIIR